MIITHQSPSARGIDIFDADTDEHIKFVLRLDSEGGTIQRYAYSNGEPQVTDDGTRAVVILERRNFRVVHRPSGQIVCQHPAPLVCENAR